VLPLLLACTDPASTDGEPGGGNAFVHDTSVESAPGTGVPDDTAPKPEDTGDDDDLEQAAYDDFYAFGVLQTVRFTLSEDTIKALNQQTRSGQFEYLSGDVQINGRDFTNVGVRIKGSSTLRNFDDKPSLKVKFNEFVPDQDFAGLERITLNNMVEDPSQTKEVMVYRLFREAGLTAPMANHAAVYVNGEFYGLYTNIETMDDHWIAHRYADDSGQLWEANDGADFTRQGVKNWERASGEADDSALQAVSDAIKGGGDYFGTLDLFVDMQEFLDFWNWRLLVGDIDGYPYTSNDCYLYGDPADGRFVFSPWGVDETWNAAAPEYWNYASGALAAGCLNDDDCASRFSSAAATQIALYETMDPVSWLELSEAADADAVANDTRRSYSLAQVQTAREGLAENLVEWPGRLRRAIGL
jgi:hypothetical protein